VTSTMLPSSYCFVFTVKQAGVLALEVIYFIFASCSVEFHVSSSSHPYLQHSPNGSAFVAPTCGVSPPLILVR
jgi:hypothetical protein